MGGRRDGRIQVVTTTCSRSINCATILKCHILNFMNFVVSIITRTFIKLYNVMYTAVHVQRYGIRAYIRAARELPGRRPAAVGRLSEPRKWFLATSRVLGHQPHRGAAYLSSAAATAAAPAACVYASFASSSVTLDVKSRVSASESSSRHPVQLDRASHVSASEPWPAQRTKYSTCSQ
eukprot:SAG22_NODE_138_length_18031_cov_5.796621_2_plen_178_part_00